MIPLVIPRAMSGSHFLSQKKARTKMASSGAFKSLLFDADGFVSSI
jgi:branched-subunit amino acid aminotransferase/4-amino-4-deoxychorismate lyase